MALVAVVVLSISVGSRPIALDRVWHLVFTNDGSDDAVVVHDLRIPRTVLGIVIGAALGVAGAVMQALTRNPLAEPGLLGINSGAAAAIVTATAVLGPAEPIAYVWFAFLGAGLVSALVYAIGAAGRSGATPVRLALAGTAITFTLYAYIQALILLDPKALDAYRFFQVGALAGHGLSQTAQIAPFVAVGLVLALLLGRPLNALGLGDEQGRSLGVRPHRIRLAGAVSIALLSGAATALVGPIAFVGLTVPHVARAITGPDHRWVIAYSALLAPVLLLGADVLGRVVARPGEVEVGVITAVVGAPLFIAIVRRSRIAQL